MFVYKFTSPRKDQLIKRVKIDGPFITFYVGKDDMQKFQDKYVRVIVKKYKFLVYGESVMHDYAHGTQNKHLDFLFGREKKSEHFHIICEGMANERELEKLFDFIADADLNLVEKSAIIVAYRNYLTQPNIDRLVMRCEGYSRVIAAILYKDPVITARMPLFLKLLNAIGEAINSAGEVAKVDPSAELDLGDFKVNAGKCLTAWMAFQGQFEVLQELKELLRRCKTEGIKEDNKARLTADFQKQLDAAAQMNYYDLAHVLPDLKNELESNFFTTDFIQLYKGIAAEMSALLGSELKFNPKPCLTKPESSSAVIKREVCSFM